MARESFASLAARAVFEDGMVLVDDEAWTREEWEVKAYQAAYAQRPEVKAKRAAYQADIRRLARLARAAGLGR